MSSAGWGQAAGFGGAVLGHYLDKEAARTQAHNDRMAASKNAAMQKEFAQHGVRWKVEDARRAGISPLAALGAQTSSFSPTYVGETAVSAGDVARETGQNISRAISKTSTAEEREMQVLQTQSARLDVEGKAIDNQIRASQLRQLNQGPAFPGSDNFMPGQGDSGVKINPSERTQHQAGRPAQDKGWITDRAFARTDTGLTPVPSKDVTERIEDKMIPEAMWAFRNNLIPTLEWLASGNSRSGAPSVSQLPDPKRQEWRWNPLRQEWYPHTWDRRR